MNPGPGTNSDVSFYRNDIDDFTHILYSFLTLSSEPNPDSPPVANWDGNALYETMTLLDISDVMAKGKNVNYDANW